MELKLNKNYIEYNKLTFKERIENIKSRYEYSLLTEAQKENIYREIDDVLREFEITNLKYVLYFKDSNIIFQPLGKINQYAFKYLMGE